MDQLTALRVLGVDPARLDRAPADPVRMPGAAARVGGPQSVPCVACACSGPSPAWSTGTIAVPGHGHRWLDLCRPHTLATVLGVPDTDAPTVPVEEVLQVLRAAARETGAAMDVITDESPYRRVLRLSRTDEGPGQRSTWTDAPKRPA
ncbi:hypothetical protein [Streptomyces minutiscleroticus]|uniref:hypothetical protein n=1 Tax=Streptomyces minutiscleroticus TaxID=68238 RepID=UPI0033172BE8